MRLFEIGNVFSASDAGQAPQETLRVAAAVSGDARAEQWGEAARHVDFHDLKGDLDSLAATAGIGLEYRPSHAGFGHPGRSADVYRDGVRIGWIGELHPRLLGRLDLDQRVIGFELDLAPLRQRKPARVDPPTKFPSVRRDLAFVVDERVPWAALENTIRGAAGPLLFDLVLFDRYQGGRLDTGVKSLAIGLILQDKSRTLADRDVELIVDDVTAALGRDHGATIRG